MVFCSDCGTKIEDGVKFCPGCGKSAGGSPNKPADSSAGQSSETWWEENYSPIPHERIPATLRATLTPKEIVVATSKIHWFAYFRQVLILIATLIPLIPLAAWMSAFDASPIAIAVPYILLFGIRFFLKLVKLRRSIMIITDQRLLGSFGVKIFSTDKLDIPLRSVDSFGVDDSLRGNIFGFTDIKLMSRASTYFFRLITKDSCQAIKNAYYAWDAKQSKAGR